MEKLRRAIKFALSYKGTDIHISEDEVIKIRVQGELIDFDDKYDKYSLIRLINTTLDDNQLQKFNEYKSIDFSKQIDDLGNFRFNVYRYDNKNAMSIRVLPASIPAFEELGFQSVIKDTIKDRNGLVLVSGPTGSGKSTLIASLINEINKNENRHIITIEDPIEYRYQNIKSLVHQREVGKDVLSYHQGLVQALRQDPDVIVLQEMREQETMATVLSAAETGHLVFSTVHTNGAASTVDRIIDAFDGAKKDYIAYLLASVLNYIVSLQLIPRIDKQGIVGVAEFLRVNSAIRNLIRERKTFQIESFMGTSQTEGMITLELSLAEYVNKGIISYEEAAKRCRNNKLLDSYISSKRRNILY